MGNSGSKLQTFEDDDMYTSLLNWLNQEQHTISENIRQSPRPLLKRASSKTICKLRDDSHIEDVHQSQEHKNDNFLAFKRQKSSDVRSEKKEALENFINENILFPRHRVDPHHECSTPVSDKVPITTESEPACKVEITGFINKMISLPRQRSKSNSSSSSSSNSSYSGCSFVEEEIPQVEIHTEESAYKFDSQVRCPQSDLKWSIPESGIVEDGLIETDYFTGCYKLYGWKLGIDDAYVFGYQDSNGKYYYVQTPKSDDLSYPYLTLSNKGEDPSNITDPSKDHRCLSYKYDRYSGKFYLHASHDLSLTVDFKSTNGYLCMKRTQKKLAKEWSISS